MDDTDICGITKKSTLTKRNWILLSVEDINKGSSDLTSNCGTVPRYRLFDSPRSNVTNKIDEINTLNFHIAEYYRRRFGGDLGSQPMNQGLSGSPHSFRRFSSTSVDNLSLKSKFQALQWKFRNEPPLTVLTGTVHPRNLVTGSRTLPAVVDHSKSTYSRRAGRLVDESFKFIDSELTRNDVQPERGLHRAELQIHVGDTRSIDRTKLKSTAKVRSSSEERVHTSRDQQLVEYSTNDGEVLAVYAKRDTPEGLDTNNQPAHHYEPADQNEPTQQQQEEPEHQRRNVQFKDENVKFFEKDTLPVTGGFVRQLCAIVKPHKRGEYYTSKTNVVSAYSPSMNGSRTMSNLDASFYSSVDKSCTLPSVGGDINTKCRSIYYIDNDDTNSITQNPVYSDEITTVNEYQPQQQVGPRKTFNLEPGIVMDTIGISDPQLPSRKKIPIGRIGRKPSNNSLYEPLKSKSFYIAIATIVFLIILTAVGVGLTVYYD